MSAISVCKNTIQQNNKRGWVNPQPCIRIAKTPGGPATAHCSHVAILDKDGNKVAEVITTLDGKPVLKCGAKVAILTTYDVDIVS